MIKINRRPPVDWFRVLAELQRAGLSQCEVARSLSLSRNRVKEWARGKCPRYDDGRALLMLWRAACLRRDILSPKRQRMRVQMANDDGTRNQAPEQLATTPVPAPSLGLPGARRAAC